MDEQQKRYVKASIATAIEELESLYPTAKKKVAFDLDPVRYGITDYADHSKRLADLLNELQRRVEEIKRCLDHFNERSPIIRWDSASGMFRATYEFVPDLDGSRREIDEISPEEQRHIARALIEVNRLAKDIQSISRSVQHSSNMVLGEFKGFAESTSRAAESQLRRQIEPYERRRQGLPEAEEEQERPSFIQKAINRLRNFNLGL